MQYLSQGLLKPKNWNVIEECQRWSCNRDFCGRLFRCHGGFLPLSFLQSCTIWVSGKGPFFTVPSWRRGNYEPDVSWLALVHTAGSPMCQRPRPSSLRLSQHYMKFNGTSYRLKQSLYAKDLLQCSPLSPSLRGGNMTSFFLVKNLESQRSNDLPNAYGHTGPKSYPSSFYLRPSTLSHDRTAESMEAGHTCTLLTGQALLHLQ